MTAVYRFVQMYRNEDSRPIWKSDIIIGLAEEGWLIESITPLAIDTVLVCMSKEA